MIGKSGSRGQGAGGSARCTKRRGASLSALALLLGPWPAASAARAEPPVSTLPNAVGQLKSGLAEMIADGTLPNAQVVIAVKGKQRVHFRMGKLDRESGRDLPENAIFRLYSMSKPITTVAAMMLVEEGRLSLDAPVSRYLPEFGDIKVYAAGELDDMTTVPTARAMTITDLLTHTSGLTYNFMGNTPVHQYYRRHGVMRGGGVGARSGDAPPASTMDELVARLAAAPLLHQPGERFSYGNSTSVLGVVIERVTGQPLEAFLRQRIFKPLEMVDTGCVVSDRQVPRFVANYAASGAGMTLVETAAQSEYRDPNRMCDGGGAFVGTARDYLNFAQMLANRGIWHGRRLLQARTVDEMFMPRIRTGGQAHEDVLFGLGLGIGDSASEAIGGVPAGAGGWSGSANTYFFVDPHSRMVALIMTNELIGQDQVARTVRLRSLLDRAAVEIRDQSLRP